MEESVIYYYLFILWLYLRSPNHITVLNRKNDRSTMAQLAERTWNVTGRIMITAHSSSRYLTIICSSNSSNSYFVIIQLYIYMGFFSIRVININTLNSFFFGLLLTKIYTYQLFRILETTHKLSYFHLHCYCIFHAI